MKTPSPFLLDILAHIIALDTTNPPGNEALAAEYLASVLAPLGFEVNCQQVAPGRSNLVATLAGGKGPLVALNGHLDVVAANPAHWATNPFQLAEQGTRLYGRGTCDMKGALCAMAAAAKRLAADKGRLKGTLQLVFVCDEELSTTGTKHFLAHNPHPDMVVIGEPTGMDVCVAHRGVSRCKITIKGKSGHASAPERAINPLYDMASLLLAIRQKNEALKQKTHPLLPPPTLAATVAEGGEQHNSIPGECMMITDRRTLPEELPPMIREEMRALALQAGIAPEALTLDFFVEAPAAQLDAASQLDHHCQRLLQQMGLPGTIRDFGACCDQQAFSAAGIDCLLVGPGHLEQAHTANEFVEKEQLALAEEFYTRFLLGQLGGS